jgi:hypothetical protein
MVNEMEISMLMTVKIAVVMGVAPCDVLGTSVNFY